MYRFVTNFQAAVNPQLTKSIAQNDVSRSHLLIIQGSRFSFFLLMLLSTPILIDTQRILSFWLVEVPPYTVLFIRWSLIYLLWDTLSRFLTNSILAKGQIKNFQLIVGGIKLLALPLAYVWLKYGGSPLVGIWINILLEIICLYFRLGFNFKFINFPWKKFVYDVVLRCWLVFALAVGFSLFFKTILALYILYSIMLNGFIASLCIFFMGLRKKERILVFNKVKKIIK